MFIEKQFAEMIFYLHNCVWRLIYVLLLQKHYKLNFESVLDLLQGFLEDECAFRNIIGYTGLYC